MLTGDLCGYETQQGYYKLNNLNQLVKHPWHGAGFGANAPAVVNALIEIPKGSRSKYEVDKETGLLKLDRVIYSSFHYPVNYGFIPQTLGQDGDPLDILVLCSQSIQSLCLVEATVIGNMQMIDNNQQDDKIIAVATRDPSVNHYSKIDDLPHHFLLELRNFFEQYKVLENKKVAIDSFQDQSIGIRVIQSAIDLYKETFIPGR